MSIDFNSRWGRLLCGLVAASVTGCGQQTPSAVTPAAEIRGERIKSASAPTTAAALESKSASTAVAPAASPAAPAEEKIDGYLVMGFDKLGAYNYEIADESNGPATNQTASATQKQDQIPASVRALDNKEVALKGFLLPLKVDGGLVTELLVMRDQSMCCYGTVPRINEWVSVKMTGKGVRPVMDQPVTLFGRLHVGEMRENGYLVGLYALDGEKMSVPME